MSKEIGLLPVLCAIAIGCVVSVHAQDAPGFDARVAMSEPRVALVIGNANYDGDNALPNPVRDAQAMAEVLSDQGFHVKLGVDLDQKEMTLAIRDYVRSLNRGGVALFYYAGHALQMNGINYLVPIKAQISDADDVSTQAIDFNEVLGKMGRARHRVNVAILDACRDYPFARKVRAASFGLAQADLPSGTIVAYAAGANKLASDGVGDNGLYTGALTEEMRHPGVKLEEVFKAVRQRVIAESNDTQTPLEWSSLVGDFYFNLERVENAGPRAPGHIERLGRSDPVAKYVVGVVGGAFVVAGAVFGVLAMNTQARADNACPQMQRDSIGCSDQAVTTSKTANWQANVSNGGFALGIVGLGIAGVIWAFEGRHTESAESRTSSARISVQTDLTPKRVGIRLSTTF